MKYECSSYFKFCTGWLSTKRNIVIAWSERKEKLFIFSNTLIYIGIVLIHDIYIYIYIYIYIRVSAMTIFKCKNKRSYVSYILSFVRKIKMASPFRRTTNIDDLKVVGL